MPEANGPAATALAPRLSRNGRLLLAPTEDAPALAPDLASRLEAAFARGSGHGLLQLGAGEVGTALPPVLAYWREFAARYVTAVCTLPDVGDARRAGARPGRLRTKSSSRSPSAAPPMTGAEYLTAAVLQALWDALDAAFRIELAESKASVQDFLKRRNPAWNLVGRVHFNLAENRKDDEAPFAFLATYTTRLSAHAKAQHLPLGQALREYAGAANKARLLSLLLPVQRAAEQCAVAEGDGRRGRDLSPAALDARGSLSAPDAMSRSSKRPASSCACRRRGGRTVRRARR